VIVWRFYPFIIRAARGKISDIAVCSSLDFIKREGCALNKAASGKNIKIIGILLIILGSAGLVIPVIPGWVLVLAGLFML
jgi:hypothetical protein